MIPATETPGEPQMNRADELRVGTQQLLAGMRPFGPLTLADVGSFGGLHRRWDLLTGQLQAIQFDPRGTGENEQTGAHPTITHPVGLADEPGTRTLHLVAFGNMSSLLPPNQALMSRFRKAGERVRVVDQSSIAVSTLDRIRDENDYNIDMIKVDTQGTELDILRGARSCLKSTILGAEIEVSFFERYREQASFTDIVSEMNSHGFELIDLFQMRRYQHLSPTNIGKQKVPGLGQTGRLAYANALFVLKESKLEMRMNALGEAERRNILHKVIAILLVYGKIDIAGWFIDRHNKTIGKLRPNFTRLMD